MSTFSKKYYSPKNQDEFLAVSWEMGYRNIQIYYKDRLVHLIKDPSPLMDGVKMNDDELGELKFMFSLGRPRVLEIKVNNRKYKTVNKLEFGYDYRGLIAVFSALALLAIIENIMFGGMYGFDFSYLEFTLVFFINFLIIAGYIITVILSKKRKPWAYFIGSSLFLLTTLFSTFGYNLVLNSNGNLMVLFFRYAILLFLVFQARHIIKEMKKAEKPAQAQDLLDDFKV